MTSSTEYPAWCEILRNAKDRLGRTDGTYQAINSCTGIGTGRLKRIFNNSFTSTERRKQRDAPSADEMLQLCKVLDLPKVRMLAELGLVESEAAREAYTEHLEELANRITLSAGLMEVEQTHGAGLIAAGIVAAGRYRVAVAPLIKGTGRFRRHYDDLVAVQPLPRQQAEDLKAELEQLVHRELAWFTAGRIAMRETAQSLGLKTTDPRTVIRVPRFVAIRRGSGWPPEPKPRCICVVGGHWSGCAAVASWLGYAFDLDFSHIGFVASRAFGRLTHENHDFNAYDREEVARTYVLGAERLGRRRVWAVGGDNYLKTFELLAAASAEAKTGAKEPMIVYLRVSTDLINWTADVRTGPNQHTTKNRLRDIEDMKEERRKVDDILRRNPRLRARTVTLQVNLPLVGGSDQPADRRDEFFDQSGRLAEQALSDLHSLVKSVHDSTFDLTAAMERMRAGGLPNGSGRAG